MSDKIKKFLEMYRSRKTRSAYRSVLKNFFNKIYGQGILEDQVNRYLNEKRNHEEDVDKFFISIQNRPPKTLRFMISVVRTFFIENDLELEHAERYWRKIRFKIRGSRAQTNDMIPTNEQLKQILSFMPIQGKALYLFLATSGMRIGEVLKLNMDDLQDGEPFRINVRGEITRSRNRRTAS